MQALDHGFKSRLRDAFDHQGGGEPAHSFPQVIKDVAITEAHHVSETVALIEKGDHGEK